MKLEDFAYNDQTGMLTLSPNTTWCNIPQHANFITGNGANTPNWVGTDSFTYIKTSEYTAMQARIRELEGQVAALEADLDLLVDTQPKSVPEPEPVIELSEAYEVERRTKYGRRG